MNLEKTVSFSVAYFLSFISWIPCRASLARNDKKVIATQSLRGNYRRKKLPKADLLRAH